MSSEDVDDKFCEGGAESQLDGEGGADETFAKENGAEGDEDKGSNEHEVLKKDNEEGKGAEKRNALTEGKSGGDNQRGKNKHVRESVNIAPAKQELTNPDLKEGIENQTTDEEKSGSEKDQQLKFIHSSNPSTKSQSRYISLMGIFLVTAMACIVVAIYLGPPNNDMMKPDFDLEKVFGNGLEKLQLSFTNQTERFWKILGNRGKAHLRNKDPSQPLVFLLAAPPAAHEYVDCLAIKLAEMLDPSHKRNLARIDGEKEKGNPPEQTKKKMDDFLKKKIDALHRVVLIHHLELLPPPSPLLFHSYCDDQNAPYKNLAIIFTVHMPVELSPSLLPKEAEGSAEKYLSGDVWANKASVDKDAVAALLVRIADTVVLMNGETSGSARDVCSEFINY
ncbi:hypothetical protein pdam_00017466 [Pocillopora damicornis]|uniref:Torsin-1A-interacting protein 1/2 AAA+ activator domain-containing protein n=1 Tax=Pocillopora damicornis TaxID=46731 RepID=A0A3M6UQU8_POCDA|nr:torsin-1A-interacting protein 2-like [Pocillopora damicornis]RMX56036.1 hypothetical protein pdam_00017466 [Pocillopora damicornis]